MKIPQRIIDNLNPAFADTVFKLLNKLSDFRLNDDNMFRFKTSLCSYDGNFKNQDEKFKAISTLNESFNLLSTLQKKIALKTLQRAQMNYNIDSYLNLYIDEMDKLITKEDLLK